PVPESPTESNVQNPFNCSTSIPHCWLLPAMNQTPFMKVIPSSHCSKIQTHTGLTWRLQASDLVIPQCAPSATVTFVIMTALKNFTIPQRIQTNGITSLAIRPWTPSLKRIGCLYQTTFTPFLVMVPRVMNLTTLLTLEFPTQISRRLKSLTRQVVL